MKTCHSSINKVIVLGVFKQYHFYFLITYGVCKKRKYCNRMSEKKSLVLMNVHVLYVLEYKTSKKKFLSVCLSVRGLLLWTQRLLKELADPNKIWSVSSKYEM